MCWTKAIYYADKVTTTVSRAYVQEFFLSVLKCIVSFYIIYYVVVSLAFGAFKLEKFHVKMPFDFKNFIEFSKCCTSYSDQQLATLITMQLAFFLTTFVIAFFIETHVWNYAFSIAIIHLMISCLVMLSFPLSWSWWVCLVSGVVLMISLGEMVCYCRRNQGQAKVFMFNKPQPDEEEA